MAAGITASKDCATPTSNCTLNCSFAANPQGFELHYSNDIIWPNDVGDSDAAQALRKATIVVLSLMALMLFLIPLAGWYSTGRGYSKTDDQKDDNSLKFLRFGPDCGEMPRSESPEGRGSDCGSDEGNKTDAADPRKCSWISEFRSWLARLCHKMALQTPFRYFCWWGAILVAASAAQSFQAIDQKETPIFAYVWNAAHLGNLAALQIWVHQKDGGGASVVRVLFYGVLILQAPVTIAEASWDLGIVHGKDDYRMVVTTTWCIALALFIGATIISLLTIYEVIPQRSYSRIDILHCRNPTAALVGAAGAIYVISMRLWAL